MLVKGLPMSLKILSYCANDGSNMQNWGSVHIQNELAHHNVEIVYFNEFDYSDIEESNIELLKHINENHYNVFISPYNEKHVYLDTILKIKSCGVATVLQLYDNLVIPFEHKQCCKYYDLVWCMYKETLHLFKEWCKDSHNTVIFAPYAANPFININNCEEINGVGFIGSPYGGRANRINTLTNNKINTYVYCKSISKKSVRNINADLLDEIICFKNKLFSNIYSFTNYIQYENSRKILIGKIKNMFNKSSMLQENQYIHFLESCKPIDVYTENHRYALSLSFTSFRNTAVLKNPLRSINLRGFEIPMSYSVYFSEYCDELAEYFEENKEVIFWRNNEEMIDKVKFYLKDAQKGFRDKIRLAARKKAEAYHTWWERYKKIFSCLNIKY